MAKNDPKVGDCVTCKYEVEAYYSGYCGHSRIPFSPGMVGTVAAIVPKVRVTGEPPICDRRDQFLVVDFDCPVTGKTERVSLNFCNARCYDVTKRATGRRCRKALAD